MREHAGFVVTLGAAVVVLGGIPATVGLSERSAQSPPPAVWANSWFFSGMIVVGLGAVLLLLAAVLYVVRNRPLTQANNPLPAAPGPNMAPEAPVPVSPSPAQVQPSSSVAVSTTALQSPPASPPDDRVFLDLTVEELQQPFHKHTTTQAASMSAQYLGRWLRVVGKLYDVTERISSDGVMATIILKERPLTVVNLLSKDLQSIDRLRVMRKDAVVAAEGRLQDVNRLHVVLEDCKIVDPTREERARVEGRLDIVRATYGAGGQTVDVTGLLRGMVRDNTLRVTASNDLVGDPAYGVVKQLVVEYEHAGVAHSKIVTEGDELVLP